MIYVYGGQFKVTPALRPEHAAYLRRFSQMQHVQRDPAILKDLPDPLRAAVGLPLGPHGGLFTGEPPPFTGSVLSLRNQTVWDEETGDQPPLPQFCSWAPTEDGTGFSWRTRYSGMTGADDTIWMKWLDAWLLPNLGEYRLSGNVTRFGYEAEDRTTYDVFKWIESKCEIRLEQHGYRHFMGTLLGQRWDIDHPDTSGYNVWTQAPLHTFQEIWAGQSLLASPVRMTLNLATLLGFEPWQPPKYDAAVVRAYNALVEHVLALSVDLRLVEDCFIIYLEPLHIWRQVPTDLIERFLEATS